MICPSHSGRPFPCPTSRTLNRKDTSYQLTVDAFQTTGSDVRGCQWRNRQLCGLTAREVAQPRPRLRGPFLSLRSTSEATSVCVATLLFQPVLSLPWPFPQHWSFDGGLPVCVCGSRGKGAERCLSLVNSGYLGRPDWRRQRHDSLFLYPHLCCLICYNQYLLHMQFLKTQ